MNEKERFLTWLDEQDYYIESGIVEEKFPTLEFEMVGITVTLDEETDKIMIPKRDYRRGLK